MQYRKSFSHRRPYTPSDMEKHAVTPRSRRTFDYNLIGVQPLVGRANFTEE